MPVLADFLPEIVEAVILGSSVGGDVAGWCVNHQSHACVNQRSVLGDDIPVMELSDRQATGACGVPQYNFDLCHRQLQGLTVTSSIPQEGEGRFDNVPPACMVLATVLTGSCSGDGPRPTPCGSACLLYTGLSDDDYAQLSKALSAK